MVKKEKLFKIYAFLYIALFVIAIVMVILDHFQIIVDIYSINIIYFLLDLNLLRLGVSSLNKKNKKKRVWGAFLVLISITWLIVQIFYLFT